ncbi:MAG: thiamine phosphate synthase [Phycisphaerales bacterium]|nr:thiamine phosphate synthase [Phycisphaerae bacterium]NNF44080.1 thiamine phosphate synthase [Phycisphaerales bacterium]NNM26836.1 thiamine phosphate synthase [Phycisphaerales bacterium]
MSVLRILDANVNRAREALRVMEDAARFLLDRADLSAELKTLRHDLVAAVSPLGALAAARDTPGDVGTGISTPSEMRRVSSHEVAIAAGKRLSEALRVLEEFAKTLDPDVAARLERLRYRGYDLEQRLARGMRAGERRQWRVCVLLEEGLDDTRFASLVEAVLAARPDCVQLREKQQDDATILARARSLVRRAAPATTVIVNDRPDIAVLSGAHGVHVGQDDLPAAAVRRLVGPDLLVGVSTSRLDQAERARHDGADYCGIGPMFSSSTKPKPVAGPAYAAAYINWDRLPHLAIGGITPTNVTELATLGVRGVAVSAAVCRAPDPAAAIGALRATLERGVGVA